MKYSEQQLLSTLREFYQKNGRTPKATDKLSINPTTFHRRFGSWNKSLVAAGLIENLPHHSPNLPPVEKQCSNCNKSFIRLQSGIKSKNVFCSQSCAAIYNNVHKKHGTRRSKLEKWIEEQLNTLYPNLEIHFNQKDAINSELDIFFPALKLAFELNGIFHYEPIYGEEKMKQIKNNDNRKFQACLEKHIELCIIDVSHFVAFNKKNAIKYLNIILNIVNQHLV